MTAFTRIVEAGVDVEAVLHYTELVRKAVQEGRIGYALLIAEKPLR